MCRLGLSHLSDCWNVLSENIFANSNLESSIGKNKVESGVEEWVCAQ